MSRADIAFVMGVARSSGPRTEETVSTKRNVDDEKRTADDLLLKSIIVLSNNGN